MCWNGKWKASFSYDAINIQGILIHANNSLMINIQESFMRKYSIISLSFLLLPAVTLQAIADPSNAHKAKSIGKPAIQFFGSWRLRPEFWSWFRAKGGADGNYSFLGSLLRLGVKHESRDFDAVLEVAQPALINLPRHAVAPPPQGQLGIGGTYRAVNGGQAASLFVKQGFLLFHKTVGKTNSFKIGRFEFGNGQEGNTNNPTLLTLKNTRIAQRLIGTFLFTDVGRSFDGLQWTTQSQGHAFTALLTYPTRGCYSLKGADTLTNIHLAYLGDTMDRNDRHGAEEGRLFGIYYEDFRGGVLKTDNRPLAARTSDIGKIRITTFGGDFMRVQNIHTGKLDGLLWAAGQMGTWGALKQGAFSFDAETGYQPKNTLWNPWFRLGYYYSSGDGNSANGQHGTFFPILPTPRIYARFPFYSESNLKDAFLSAIIRPRKGMVVRADAHALSLANKNDLWYVGGGAYDNSAFGYVGRPSGGSDSLATLYDISLDYQLRKTTEVGVYFGYARGGGVVQANYSDRYASFGFFELDQQF